jgi:hypothetical protein
VPRWLAVGLGCVTALGMQALFDLFAARSASRSRRSSKCSVASSSTLGLAGYVTGHLVGQAQVM